MSTSPVNLSSAGLLSPATGAATSSPAQSSPATSDLANQNVFLQLLVAQLKYQDPENPADGTTFITQLAQFSELSNSTQMVSDLGTIQTDLTPSAAAATQAATGTTTNGTGTTTPAGTPGGSAIVNS
jgi:flagellar basal-body rod modification protein FlgD